MPENHLPHDVQPTLSLSFEDVGKLRVRPAEFARMVGVSKQTVSQWVSSGKVTLGPDGRLDPVKASSQVVANSDPSRLRARVLREAVMDSGSLRRRIADLERQLADAQARITYLDNYIDEEELALEIAQGLLAERFAPLLGENGEAPAVLIAALFDEASLRAGGLWDELEGSGGPLEGGGRP